MGGSAVGTLVGTLVGAVGELVGEAHPSRTNVPSSELQVADATPLIPEAHSTTQLVPDSDLNPLLYSWAVSPRVPKLESGHQVS